MDIIETTRPYETLIRHHADGSIGAHHQRLYELIKDGVTLSSQMQAPVQLSVAGEEGLPLADILGETTAAALLATEAAQTARAKAEAELTTAKAQLDAATAQAATLLQQLDTARAELVALAALRPEGSA